MSRSFGALQGLAILVVILNHSILTGLDIQRLGYPAVEGLYYYILEGIREIGVFAVPTFLFISGCFFSYAARRETPPTLSWKVVWTGLKHLLYPYLIWSVIFYILIYLSRDQTYSFLGYLKNLVVGYPFHFIPLIALFYLLSPILVRLARRFGWVLIVAITLYQLILIEIVFPGTLNIPLPDWMRYISPPIVRTTLAQWAIYFPLGLVYAINSKHMLPGLQKLKGLLVTITLILFVITICNKVSLLHFPIASFICPVSFVLLTPLIQRNSIPAVRELEKIGMKGYGLYLTHFIVLELVVLGIHFMLPWIFSYQILLQPILFIAALRIPLLLMDRSMRLPTQSVYRYVFG